MYGKRIECDREDGMRRRLSRGRYRYRKSRIDTFLSGKRNLLAASLPFALLSHTIGHRTINAFQVVNDVHWGLLKLQGSSGFSG